MSSRNPRGSRSRSPYREGRDETSGRHRQDARRRENDAPAALPLDAGQLTKQDLKIYRPMFALYLDIQKRLDISDLTEDEVRGRWKSFMNKWNRGDLAEGWYDPLTLTKARRSQDEPTSREPDVSNHMGTERHQNVKHPMETSQPHPEDDDDDDYGPVLPYDITKSTHNHPHRRDIDSTEAGPAIPSLQDIQSRNEDTRVAAETAREQRLKEIRHERQLDRKLQKSQLDEIVPRAEAGTRERQLEKKREVADSNRAFAAQKDTGGDVEIRDSDLLGGDDLGELKRMKKEQDRRKTEREIKREEILRARTVERDQKLRVLREKEEKTMSMLRDIARERFGNGNEHAATLRDEQEQ